MLGAGQWGGERCRIHGSSSHRWGALCAVLLCGPTVWFELSLNETEAIG